MTWAVWGAVSAFTAVAAGAFGAHGLKDRLPPDQMAIFETGVRYQMYHALALLAAGLVPGGRWVTAAGGLFIAGTALFSGSLYALALSGGRAWGPITPVGGMAFLAGWICLAAGLFRVRENQ